MSAISPNNTVYVRNLEERIKLPELSTALREIFSEFGTILDIVCKRNLRARGQAFIVFEDVDSAETAIEMVQGFDLFDKPMELAFARTPSDAVIKEKGTAEELELHQRRRKAEKERKQAALLAEKAKSESLKRPAAEEGREKTGAKIQKTGTALKSTARSGVIADEYLPPNKILFVQNTPEDYNIEALSAVFGRFEGFKEVRLVPGRSGLAFVEYEAESGAISAKESTAGMALGGQQIKVTYQRQ